MSIKPVGFLYQLTGKADTTLVTSNKVRNFEQFNPKWRKSVAVYAIPDTHRVVPVELLKMALESIPWELRDSEASLEIRAIIEDKPCSQS